MLRIRIAPHTYGERSCPSGIAARRFKDRGRRPGSSRRSACSTTVRAALSPETARRHRSPDRRFEGCKSRSSRCRRPAWRRDASHGGGPASPTCCAKIRYVSCETCSRLMPPNTLASTRVRRSAYWVEHAASNTANNTTIVRRITKFPLRLMSRAAGHGHDEE